MNEAKVKASLKIKDLENLSRIERNGLCVWLRNIVRDVKDRKKKYAKNAKWTIYY